MLFELAHLLLHKLADFLLVSLVLQRVLLLGDLVHQCFMLAISLILVDLLPALDLREMLRLVPLMHLIVVGLLHQLISDLLLALVDHPIKLLTSLFDCDVLLLAQIVQTIGIEVVFGLQSLGLLAQLLLLLIRAVFHPSFNLFDLGFNLGILFSLTCFFVEHTALMG